MAFAEKIEGQRIILERPPLSFELAEELLKSVEESRNDMLPWLRWAATNKKPEDEYGWLLNWSEKHWQEDSGYAYIIKKKADGKLLGSIDVVTADYTNKHCEIGYWLRSSEVGNGYMHEAVSLLEKEAFTRGFNRIIIRNDVRNLRSANVAAKAGYHLDGIMRQDSYSEHEKCFVSHNIWSKLKEEYNPD